jgi:hypothetical protein
MANGAGFPGKTNKVYPDPVPKRSEGPTTTAPSGRGAPTFQNPGVVPGLRTSPPEGKADGLPPTYGTPMGAKRGENLPTWDAPVNGYPQPEKDGPDV